MSKKEKPDWKEAAIAIRNKYKEQQKLLRTEKHQRRKAEQDSNAIEDTFQEYSNIYAGNVRRNTYHVDKLKQEELMALGSAHSDIQAAINSGKSNMAFKITKYAAIVIIALIFAALVTRQDVRDFASQNIAGFVAIIIGCAIIFVYANRKKD